ncbi:MAG TPA: Rap1a/Tai family immunity protein [Stellaceae bacterium]|nr:Rap1a/Tai family immunity protein [Stellaceae bacterium]
MRSTIYGIAIALATAALPTAAQATGPNVKETLAQCSAKRGSPDWLSCAAYVAGVSDAMMTNAATIKTSGDPKLFDALAPFSMCVAGDIVPTYGDRLEVFKHWAETHPELWGEPTYSGVMSAMRETWHCTPALLQDQSN